MEILYGSYYFLLLTAAVLVSFGNEVIPEAHQAPDGRYYIVRPNLAYSGFGTPGPDDCEAGQERTADGQCFPDFLAIPDDLAPGHETCKPGQFRTPSGRCLDTLIKDPADYDDENLTTCKPGQTRLPDGRCVDGYPSGINAPCPRGTQKDKYGRCRQYLV